MTRIAPLLAAALLIAACVESTEPSSDEGVGGTAGSANTSSGGGHGGSVATGTGGTAGGGAAPGTGGTAGGGAAPGGQGGGAAGGWPDVAACHVGSADCADACHLVDCCAGGGIYDECVSRCEASLYIETNGIECLALRVFWIDEDGCDRIVGTYDAFEANDDCTGPPPF